MVTVHRYLLVREKLLVVPQHERDLFLALGSVANELILLQKLIIWTLRGPTSEPFLQAQHTQAIVLFRLLGGKLHEAWQLMHKAFFGAKVAREYDGQMEPEAQEALDFIKCYHSSPNVLDQVRNEYAFHFSAPRFGDGLNHTFIDPLTIYVSPLPANNLFFCSELLANASLMAERSTDEEAGKFGELIDQAARVTNHWLYFIIGYHALFIKRHRAVLDEKIETLQLEQVQSIDSISIPWFIDTPLP